MRILFVFFSNKAVQNTQSEPVARIDSIHKHNTSGEIFVPPCLSQLVPPPIFVQGQVVKESYSKDQPRFETREQGNPSLSWGLAEGTL